MSKQLSATVYDSTANLYLVLCITLESLRFVLPSLCVDVVVQTCKLLVVPLDMLLA